ncbi:MAG: DUF1592 domain-containing protein, partial [Lentisphaeraceae bacterium]|nr:DUF1592 domain-containing protein [Lentisphaeraceae bacterium]
MPEKKYDQNHFKMFCPACEEKLVIKDSAVGQLFNCPKCDLEISTPNVNAYEAVEQEDLPAIDPLKLLANKVEAEAAVKEKKRTQSKDKKSITTSTSKSPRKLSVKSKNLKTSRKKKNRFPIIYLFVPVIIYLFTQIPKYLEEFGFLHQEEELVQVKKKIEAKQKIKQVVEELPETIEIKKIVLKESVKEGFKPLDIADKQKVEVGNTMTSIQVKALVGHLKTHCYECHGDKLHEEELNFQSMKTTADFFKNYINFKMTLKYLESSEMPPPEDGLIPEEERLEFIDLVGRLLYTIESKSEGKTGPAKIRRLSAVAYDNTVKSITGLTLNLSKMHQIDNSDDISTVSMEKFLGAAQEIAQYARFDLSKGFVFDAELRTSRKPADVQNEYESKKREILKEYYFSDFSYLEALSRSMKAVNQFNASKDKSKQLVSKLANRHKIHEDFLMKSLKYFNGRNFVLLAREGLKDWMLLKRDKYDNKKARIAIKSFISHYESVLAEDVKPNSIRERLISEFKGKIEGLFQFTHSELQQRINDDDFQKYLRISSVQDLLLNGQKSSYYSFFKETFNPKVNSLLSSLFRRPANKTETDQFMSRMIKFMPIHGLDNTIRIMMTNVFSNLKFIFRFEQKRGVEAKVDGFELANRLSYFLWNSPPDSELIELAESGKLFQKDVLVPHIQKMLQDERASSFAEEFANTWLGISAVKNMEMEDDLNLDMYNETVLFFDYVIRNEVKVTDLINGQYSFMNSKLLAHYDIDKRSVLNFEKIDSLDEKRGGLLGQAAILAMTSVEGRTNPILRGNFVLNTILGTPTPPPPANAGELPEKEKVAGRSLKDVL